MARDIPTTPLAESRPVVLIAEGSGFPSDATTALAAVAEVRVRDLDRRELLLSLRDVEALWVRLRFRIDQELLDAAPVLRVLVTATTGMTHVDEAALERRGVRLVALRGEARFLEQLRGTAEHTVLLMLALLRQLPQAVGDVHQGRWNRDAFRGHELHGRTVGLVGFGRLGRIVSEYLHAFGATVLVADPAVDPASVPPHVQLVPLVALLHRASVVSMHASLDAGNRGFFGAPEFARMPRGSWFVNTARGELVDERALLNALDNGHLAGAAVDVVAGEPDITTSNPLIAAAGRLPQLIVTPHIGGATHESMAKAERFLVAKAIAALGVA